jgi:hypothetical protein
MSNSYRRTPTAFGFSLTLLVSFSNQLATASFTNEKAHPCGDANKLRALSETFLRARDALCKGSPLLRISPPANLRYECSHIPRGLFPVARNESYVLSRNVSASSMSSPVTAAMAGGNFAAPAALMIVVTKANQG